MSTTSHPGIPLGGPRNHGHGEHPHHGRAFTVLGIALVLLSAIAIGGFALRRHLANKHAAAVHGAEADRGPHVLVTRVEKSAGAHDYTLPAEARGYFQSTAYAKVSGYVRRVLVDKGDWVKKGQILGFVESPETDQLVRGAQSDLILRKQLYARAKRLAPDVVSQTDLDTATSNLEVSNASLLSALATQGYETIRSAFDGIVTMRYVDPGALLPAATGATTSAQPFVDIADPRRLRIWAYVGQDEAIYVTVGTPVTVSQRAGDVHLDAQVTRTAAALDPRTRTMLCEMVVDNPKGVLLPGAFSQATFHIQSPPLPKIPAEALVLRKGDEFVPVVRDNRVHMANVKSGVSDGKTIQIISGLQEGEIVALNIPAELADGDAVQATERPAAAETGAPGGGPKHGK